MKKKAIIFKAVNDCKQAGDRTDVARASALLANKRGVNVQSAPYLQDIFIEALDKKEREGCFKE